MKEVDAACRERARAMKDLPDATLYNEVVAFVNDPANINKSPHLVTALRDLGLWPRIEQEGIRRRNKSWKADRPAGQ